MKKTLIFLTLLLSFNQVMAKTRHHLLIPSVFSYIVYDFEHNAILKEKNSTQTHSIASLTKLMTANVFLTHETSPELCTNHLTEEDIDHLKHTHSRLPQNDTFTCDKLLQAMLISSDNMAASALSRSIKTLTKNQFIDNMNNTAKSLGMMKTHYVDSSGLSPLNISSANDLVSLMKKSLTNQKITNITSKPDSVIVNQQGQLIYFKNTNKLIREYKFEADLSKTGYINESGYNLIYVHKNSCNNKKIGMVILGASSSASRSSQAMHFLKEYGCIS